MVEDKLPKDIARDKSNTSRGSEGLLYDTKLRHALLSEVRLNPQERIRQESGDYKFHPKYNALKESMLKYGLFHQITLKQEGSRYKLLAGFYRFCVAVDLGWETILAKIYPDHISEYDEIRIELIENNNRKDFTSYQFYEGLGRAKRLYEKEYPETNRGKYRRGSDSYEDH